MCYQTGRNLDKKKFYSSFLVDAFLVTRAKQN